MMPFLPPPLLVLCLLLLSYSNWAFSKNAIHFSYLKEVFQNEQLALNAVVDFKLPEQVVAAIQHDISILFKTEIVLFEKRNFLGFQREQTQKKIEYYTELYGYGVNRYYVLYNHRNHKRQTFQTLENALQTLGTLQALPVVNQSVLDPEKRYFFKIRISLDKWKLPPPLFIEALLETYWHLDSDWQEIMIQLPKSE
ncbi:MAG TPA: DUF4390 domain-containing protein [Thiomicrorhabdus sp.]|nr:DUF4390 domain-containing protein [Thiomicrorhabdus sp.]